ncbi:MAG TPA: cytochrome c biogenesis protein CcdA, partial [Hyphomicrobiales bacterium]|nr:cytochrome c biogenesis protein CcdA [Hyphomicrobiales bacterium]
LVAFLGGVLTILSPCILPVLPFVFSRAGQPFVKTVLPMLGGMALTFAVVASLVAVGGGWAVQLNEYGRVVALLFLALFAVTLLSRRLADLLTRPLVAFGNRLLANDGTSDSPHVLQSLLLGVAVGFLWVPCAGPILGIVLTGAAISGPSAHTTFLLFAYAAGAATSLALATLAGGRVFNAMKRSLGASEWIRRGLGGAVLLAVIAITFGWDTGVLTRLSLEGTNRVEQALLDRFGTSQENAPEAMTAMSGGAMTGGAMTGGAMTGGAMTGGAMTGGAMTGGAMMAGNSMMMRGATAGRGLPIEGRLPAFDGVTAWLNSEALTPDSLRGKVVLIDFWTYSCINCLRALPYVTAWYDKYRDAGLVVIGVHSPEFAFEKNERNVRRAMEELGITYPVALDNDYAVWKAFNNQYWPAHYFIDATGSIRAHHFGEGGYEESEQIIRQLLTEAGMQNLPGEEALALNALGAQAPPDQGNLQSPETYIGYERAENFISPGGFVPDAPQPYEAPSDPRLNQWGLAGTWTVDSEKAVLQDGPGKILFRFFARDLHLVLGPGEDGQPVRFRVLIDGLPPTDSHGADVDAEGNGVVQEERLYQLIRQTGTVGEHTFTIEFLDAGVHAYSFTFG